MSVRPYLSIVLIALLLFFVAFGTRADEPTSAQANRYIDVNAGAAESLLASDLMSQLPPSKLLPYLGQMQSVAGPLNSMKYTAHIAGEYRYELFGTQGNVLLQMTVDANDKVTWFHTELAQDSSPAHKAHLSLPELDLKKPGE